MLVDRYLKFEKADMISQAVKHLLAYVNIKHEIQADKSWELIHGTDCQSRAPNGDQLSPAFRGKLVLLFPWEAIFQIASVTLVATRAIQHCKQSVLRRILLGLYHSKCSFSWRAMLDWSGAKQLVPDSIFDVIN